MIGQFGDVQQAFEAVFQSDEDAEVRDLGNSTLNELPWLVLLGNGADPWILVKLLQAESDAATALVDRQNAALDFCPFSTTSLG